MKKKNVKFIYFSEIVLNVHVNHYFYNPFKKRGEPKITNRLLNYNQLFDYIHDLSAT
jgi:hypothetical protein